MKYIDNILHLEQFEYIKDDAGNGFVTGDLFRQQCLRNQIKVCGTHGKKLISYDSLPPVYKNLVDAAYEPYGGVYEYAALQPIRDLIVADYKAVEFFDTYIKPNGKPLEDDLKMKYRHQAAFMKMIDKVYADKKWLKKTLKKDLGWFWKTIPTFPEAKKCGLDISERHLKPKYDAWKNESYTGLISGRIGNVNRLKADVNIENLILSLYIQNNKPYASEVHSLYEQFMNGKIKLVDDSTGELFNTEDYLNNGQPVELSVTTVWNIINNPINRAVVDSIRMSKLEYSNTHRPHVIRQAPVYAFSKITMDDLSIPFKMADGKRVWSYQIFDVASGCVVGYSFARSTEDGSGKNRGLFIEAMKSMFRLIVNNDFAMPYEIEVEHHISNTFKGKENEVGEFVADLLTDGFIFPQVRWCNPSSPSEKRAEHIIKGKKYTHQNKREGFQRRPFARLEANRLNIDKNKTTYTFDEIVANEEYDIHAWNNSLHPKQDKYKGLTRWQVLQQYQNPNLKQPHLPTLAKYIGRKTPTSVHRTMVTVQYGKYRISNDDLLLLNNYPVTAYYIPNKNQPIPEVYVYQNDNYVCTAKKVDGFNESAAEETEFDKANKQEQQAHQAVFDARIKQRKKELKKIAVVQNEVLRMNDEAEVYEEPVNYDNEFSNVEYDNAVMEIWQDNAINDL